jgi:MFS family permease
MHAHTAPSTPARERRVALATMAASSIEWYDFFIYGTAAALVFGKVFFPAFSPVAAILASFATFGVGFLARPLGGIVFGHFGDKLGRKPMLVVALALMGVATTLVGLLPTYDSIGVLAPLALVLLRLAQGLAVGGQWGGAMLLATEHAPPGRRGLYGSFVQLGVPIGLVVGNGVYLIVARTIAPEQFLAWGWRVPFLLSVVLVGLAFYIHHRIDDTPEFQAAEEKLAAQPKAQRRSPVLEVLRHHPRQVFLAAGAFLIVNIAFYVLVTGMLDYGTRTLGIGRSSMLAAVLIATATMIVFLPLFAGLSDVLGRRRVYAFGATALGAWSFALFPLVQTRNFALIVLALVVALGALSAMYGPQAALFAEIFPAHLRYSGASLGYQLSSVAGGGPAPFLMVLLLETTGTPLSVAVLIAASAALALLCLSFISITHEKTPAPALAAPEMA